MEDLRDYLKNRQQTLKNPNLHSELHALVDEVRQKFGETATKGVGSFAFYLGFFKRLGVQRVHRILAEVEQSNANDPARLFWYKVKEEFKK
jgi:hypothetical protein